jgi:hypothetical protein
MGLITFAGLEAESLPGVFEVTILDPPASDRHYFLFIGYFKYHPVWAPRIWGEVAFEDVTVGEFPVAVISGWVPRFQKLLNEYRGDLRGLLLVFATVDITCR